ncbi:hypothetical protein ACDI16_13290 [Oceanobacillus caeni]
MSFSDYIIKNEKTLNSAKDIKYLFMPSKTQSNYLIVTFSGFNGQEALGVPASYNYTKILSKIDCNRLFILDDYDGHPCYYLGKNKYLDYEVSVASLIYSIANKCNIPYKNIITCGSSKGGTAAVYIGIKYGFGHILAGGFQIKVGDYLYNVNQYAREQVLKLITGGISEKHKDYLNNFFMDFINHAKWNGTTLHLHGGKGDPHYLNHVSLFTHVMDKRHIPYNLDLKDYDSHSKLGTYFSDFILEKIPEITGSLLIKEVFIRKNEKNELLVSCSVPKCFSKHKSTQYAFYIYKEGLKEPIDKIMYSSNSSLKYKVESGKYTVRVFVKNNQKKVITVTQSISI